VALLPPKAKGTGETSFVSKFTVDLKAAQCPGGGAHHSKCVYEPFGNHTHLVERCLKCPREIIHPCWHCGQVNLKIKGEEEEEALATNRKKIKVATLANSLAIYRDKLND
jgi:hypothetical protein